MSLADVMADFVGHRLACVAASRAGQGNPGIGRRRWKPATPLWAKANSHTLDGAGNPQQVAHPFTKYKENSMEFRIHYTLPDGSDDSTVVAGETIEEIQAAAQQVVAQRCGSDPWSEPVS